MTATYIRHGRGRSINAEIAMSNNRLPASHIAKALGKGCTAAFISANAPSSGEWHHVGKYAQMVDFYDLDAVLEWFETAEAQELFAEYKAARKAENQAKKNADKIIADVSFDEWNRVAINSFGKLAWRPTHVSLKAVQIRYRGSFVEIEGYGRKAAKNLTIREVTPEELKRRKRSEAAKKAAETRKRNTISAQEAAKANNH